MTSEKHIKVLRLATEIREGKQAITELRDRRFEGSFESQIGREQEIIKRSEGHELLVDELLALVLGETQRAEATVVACSHKVCGKTVSCDAGGNPKDTSWAKHPELGWLCWRCDNVHAAGQGLPEGCFRCKDRTTEIKPGVFLTTSGYNPENPEAALVAGQEEAEKGGAR